MLESNITLIIGLVIIAMFIIMTFIFVIMIYVNTGKKNDESEKISNKIQQMQIEVLKNSHEGFVKLLNQNKEDLSEIRDANEKKLNIIEHNINEKLDKSLNDRLDNSFKTIGEQLQTLQVTNGKLLNMSHTITDLQKSLSNVKVRGVFGEKQLENILESIMTSNMYETQFKINKNSEEKVDFAIKIPNKEDDGFIYLPIDSKFPNDKYMAIVEASENHDEVALENAIKDLKSTIIDEAKSISQKYIVPSVTTDFAIMFLPTEGLYAEALRIDSLADDCQKNYHILLAGPTTITAIINSISVGFKFLQINKNSKEIAKVLEAIKGQFTKFGEEIDKTKRNIALASESTDKLSRRNEMITNKLKNFGDISITESNEILEIEENV